MTQDPRPPLYISTDIRGMTDAIWIAIRQLGERIGALEGLQLKKNWRSPTPEEITTPAFNAIWDVIKTWDINVPSEYRGYSGATGNHVCAILDTLKMRGLLRVIALKPHPGVDISSPHPPAPRDIGAEQTWPAVHSPSDAEYQTPLPPSTSRES